MVDVTPVMRRRPHRNMRVVSYAAFTGAGVAAMGTPSPSIAHASGPWVHVWAAFLLLGGLVSCYGAVTDRWIGELAGLPLLFTAAGVYALIIGAGYSPAKWASLLFLVAVTAKLVARWQDVRTVSREATALARDNSGG